MDAASKGDVDWRRGRVGAYIHYAGDDVLDVAKNAYLQVLFRERPRPQGVPEPGPLRDRRRGDDARAAQWRRRRARRHDDGRHGEHLPGRQVGARLGPRRGRPPSGRRSWCRRPLIRHSTRRRISSGSRCERVPVGKDFRADADAMAAAIGPRTIMLVGSAPAYPHGVMDPIAAIAAIAQKHDLWMHVDACVGGFIAPFARSLGEPIGDFDFAVPGVVSMSADLHKYGYAAKGASTVCIATPSRSVPGLLLLRLAARPLFDPDPGRDPGGRRDRGGVGGDELPGRGRLPRHHAAHSRHP